MPVLGDTPETASTLLRGAFVVDVVNGTSDRADVLIESGAISRVETSLDGIAGIETEISAVNLWLIPGLVDCHVHLVGSNVGREPFGRYVERNPEVRPFRIAAHAAEFLAAGVTTLRHLGHGNPEHIKSVQEAADAGTILSPRLLSCGWAVSQTGGHGDLPGWPIDLLEELRPSAAFCDGPENLRLFVREQEALGASWIKLFATQGTISTEPAYANLPNFTSEELTAVVTEAHSLGMRVAAHATGLEGAVSALRAGVDTLEHGPSVADDEFFDVAATSGATIVPTLSVTAWAAREGAVHGLPKWATERSRRRLADQIQVLRALRQLGIPTAVGSDSGTLPRVMGTNEEISELADAGFAPVEILEMATLASARALRMDGQIGSIEVGKRADMVALTVDPLVDPRIIADRNFVSFVVKDGVVIGRGERSL